jgi:hypothetical protein
MAGYIHWRAYRCDNRLDTASGVLVGAPSWLVTASSVLVGAPVWLDTASSVLVGAHAG